MRGLDLLTQLNNAMAYIEKNITDDEALSHVSETTHYSPYHFQRIFNYIADMPLAEYIRRRKLSLAAEDLQSDGERILDLAVKYGYDSADSFTRAFARQHGVSPSAARRSGVHLQIYPPLTFQIQIKGVQKMNWRIEKREAFDIFGLERVFKHAQSGKVPDFWRECMENGEYDRLFQAAGSAEQKSGPCLINAACGYRETDKDSFSYILFAQIKDGCDVSGFTTARIPKATWAVFRSEVSDTIGKQIPKLFHRAYSEWLPSSGYDKASGPDLEIYAGTEDGRFYEEAGFRSRRNKQEAAQFGRSALSGHIC